MSILSNYLDFLSDMPRQYCWYIVKQDTKFWKQCYYVSILESFKKQEPSENLETFFSRKIEEINSEKNLGLHPTHRALRVAYYYGLIDNPSKSYSSYNNAVATNVYKDILNRTNGNFEKTENYSDIINGQIEKIFISSAIDEGNEGIRKDFEIFPCIFLYKILLELGKASDDYSISMDEYKYIVSTQTNYKDFLNCLFLIIESRRDGETFFKKCKEEFRDKIDNRFNLVLSQLNTISIESSRISLNIDKLNHCINLVRKYEAKEFGNFSDYIDFLTNQSFKNKENNSFALTLSKPFLMLAGISGTGKTRFVREQAKRWSETLDNYCLIPVRPDWHEPSDLLGYVSRLSGNAEYVVTDLLKFIVKAWRVIAQELTFEGNAVKGSEETLGRINPFWLCLDEMNLAPVEQYFADYLSILETREWEWEGNEFKYRSDGLLSVDLFNQFKTNSNFLHALGFKENKDENNENDKTLLKFFEQNGIPLPFNLIVAGAVNMDETTHGFSRKVLDRALSFDFSEFYPNNFEQFFEPLVQAVTLTYPHHSTATKLKTNLDSLSQEYNIIQESLNFLGKMNELFIGTPFKLAYRALNELLLNVWSFQPSSQAELQAVWDDFLMLKVLPRLEGDQDKLAFDNEHSLFDKLEEILKEQLSEIWAQDKSRVDFFNEDLEGNKLNNLQCRSRQKLEQMKKQLERQHFTTFWQ